MRGFKPADPKRLAWRYSALALASIGAAVVVGAWSPLAAAACGLAGFGFYLAALAQESRA